MKTFESILIEGCPLSGKKSVIGALTKLLPNIQIKEKGIFYEQHEKHWSLWQKTNRPQKTLIIVLEAEPDVLVSRVPQNDKEQSQFTTSFFFLKRYRFRQLSAYYGNVHLINTSNLSVDDTAKIIKDIYEGKTNEYIVPSVDEISQSQFDSMPKVIQGESKIIRTFNKRFQIIQYIASVHSHKQQRSGIVEGTDKERMKMTKSILDIFSRYEIKHSYFYIGENFILNESKNPEIDLPPVEIIVKRCFVGSDKVRYYKMDEIKNRFGKPVVNKEKQNEYQKLLVRFDYRNPNYNPETKEPMGDLPLCDDLADEFINAAVAKKWAKFIFTVLDEHFSKMNLYFEDVCFMLTVEGDTMYGEVSQDCGRYKYIHEHKLTDLDKDVWRNWGSFDLLLKQYKMITNIITNYVKKTFYGLEVEEINQ